MNLEFGMDIRNEALSPLSPIIRGWSTAIKRYCKINGPTDPPYYYNERANISLLSAGAWLSGSSSLEEYGTVKGRGTDTSNGRSDLYIIIDNDHECVIEAKHRWIPAPSSKDRIKSGLRDALYDAKRNYDAKVSIGCTFFVVRFPASNFPDYEGAETRYIREELSIFLSHRADLWAWCFPRTMRKSVLFDENSVWPGIVIGLRVARKAWEVES